MEQIPVPPLHPMPNHGQQGFHPAMSGAIGGHPLGQMGRGQPQHVAGPHMMGAMGRGQHQPGVPDILGHFNNMKLNGGQPVKGGADQGKPKQSPPTAKPGTITAYEGYTFDRLDGWEVASRRSIRVSEQDLERKVAAKKNRGNMIDIFKKMSAGRRAQIDRLMDEKNRDEKEAQWYTWTPIALEDGKSREVSKGGRKVREVLSMDVFIGREVRKDIPEPKTDKEKDKDKDKDKDKKSSKPNIYGGTVVDIRQPLKSKEAAKPKDPFAPAVAGNPMNRPPDHGGGIPQFRHFGDFGGHVGAGLGGHAGGHGGAPLGGHGGGHPGGALGGHGGGHMGGVFGGQRGGHPGGVQHGGGHVGGGHPAGALGGFGGGHDILGGHGGRGGHDGKPQGGHRNQPPVQIIQNDAPVGGGAKRRHSSHGNKDPFKMELPQLHQQHDPLPKINSGKFVPEDDSSFEDEDGFSHFDDDERSSATSAISLDLEKPVPRRGSLKSTRRRSKGGEGPIYREHRREKSYRDPHRRRESRYQEEAVDMYPERARRPDLGRRSTVAYAPAPRRITNGDTPPLSPRAPSPRRSSGLMYPDEYDRWRAKERDAEDYFRRRDEEEDHKRRQRDFFALERERQRREEMDRFDFLERLSRRSDPLDRYGRI